ncbi:MAG TPA: hypothetical protein VK175_10125 [Leadbetterella sp.]|nr:hypothetical protein [Leadbetterella sp.]
MERNESLHLFFHLVKRPKDFFTGVKKKLDQYENIIAKDIILDDKYYDIIDEAEYAKVFLYSAASELKILRRAINYRKVFRELERLIWNVIDENKFSNKVYFYLADEGVWGEFIKVLKHRITEKCNVNITIINIQHGFFMLRDGPALKVRHLVNKIFKFFNTYPILGYGFGGSKLDTYFVYGKLEKEFVSKHAPQSKVIVSPMICKGELIDEVYELQQSRSKSDEEIRNGILFAAQLNEINPDCSYSEEELTQKIAPLFKLLKEKGYHVYYRLHPAIPDKDRYIKLLKKYGILENVILANEKKLSEYLVLVGSVMAIQSTTLYDGFVVGRMPVVIRGLSKHFEFTTAHESIDLKKPLDMEVWNAFKNIDRYYRDVVTFELEPEVKFFFNNI